MRNNFRAALAAARCLHIQIDEPLFTLSDDAEVEAAVDAINLAIEGLSRELHVSIHICQGNVNGGKAVNKQGRPPVFRLLLTRYTGL